MIEERAAEYSAADDGLSKVGGTLQQIPTYVTAVPNGTERVRDDPTKVSTVD